MENEICFGEKLPGIEYSEFNASGASKLGYKKVYRDEGGGRILKGLLG